MNWQELKDKIYFEDGSLRDILVFNTTRSDWQKWADLVNEKYSVEFHDAKTDLISDKIDFNIVEEYLKSTDRDSIKAAIKVGSVIVMCHFFDDSEIENDISPREFKSQSDHDNLICYLDDIAAALNKEVCITVENTQGSILLKRIPSLSHDH